jgi:hypothetical protein
MGLERLTSVIGDSDGGYVCKDGQDADSVPVSVGEGDEMGLSGAYTTRSTRMVSLRMRIESIKYTCRWTQRAILAARSVSAPKTKPGQGRGSPVYDIRLHPMEDLPRNLYSSDDCAQTLIQEYHVRRRPGGI